MASAAEQQRLRDTLSGLEQAGRIELGWVTGQTWRDLRDAMRHGPWHVFHFIGHGGFNAASQEGTLALVAEDNSTYHLSADNLAMLLRGHPSLRLVLLNACDTGRGNALDPFSSVAGALIRRGVPAVLAMQYEITDSAALEFGRTFYECLADQLSVDLSVMQARQAIRLASPGARRSAGGGIGVIPAAPLRASAAGGADGPVLVLSDEADATTAALLNEILAALLGTGVRLVLSTRLSCRSWTPPTCASWVLAVRVLRGTASHAGARAPAVACGQTTGSHWRRQPARCA